MQLLYRDGDIIVVGSPTAQMRRGDRGGGAHQG